MLFGERGQAFSTFQLLIAAIVAIIILTFLLGILGFIPNIGNTTDPVKSAADILDKAFLQHGQLIETTVVTFNSGSVIDSRKIASFSRNKILPEQICVHPGDNLNKTVFEDQPSEKDVGGGKKVKMKWRWSYDTEDGYIVQSLSESLVNMKIKSLCGPKRELLKFVKRYEKDEGGIGGIESEWFEQTPITDKQIQNLKDKKTELENEKSSLESEISSLDPETNQNKINEKQKRIGLIDKQLTSFDARISDLEQKRSDGAPASVDLINKPACYVLDNSSSQVVCVVFLSQEV